MEPEKRISSRREAIRELAGHCKTALKEMNHKGTKHTKKDVTLNDKANSNQLGVLCVFVVFFFLTTLSGKEKIDFEGNA